MMGVLQYTYDFMEEPWRQKAEGPLERPLSDQVNTEGRQSSLVPQQKGRRYCLHKVFHSIHDSSHGLVHHRIGLEMLLIDIFGKTKSNIRRLYSNIWASA